MTIDWTDPSDDVLCARGVGYYVEDAYALAAAMVREKRRREGAEKNG